MKRIKLFGQVPFDKINNQQLIAQVLKFISKRKKKLFVNLNIHSVTEYFRNEKFATIVDKSDISFADGWGPVLAAKFAGTQLPGRVNVGDFIDDLLENLNEKKYSLYLLGCEEHVVIKTAKTILDQYPNIKLKGFRNGFFDEREEERIVEQIFRLKPQIVLVGMGVPRQEYFINDNWQKLPNSVFIGVGGVFYYISNLKSRAPVWMRNNSLEWLYRLVQEPRRLWRRYTIDNLYFIYLVFKHLLFKNIS